MEIERWASRWQAARPCARDVIALAALLLAACSLDFDGYHLNAGDRDAGARSDGGSGLPDHGDGAVAPGTDGATSSDDGGGDGAVAHDGGDTDAAASDAGDAASSDAGDAGADSGHAIVCGDDMVEGDELCDGDCPTSCDDGDPCTTQALLGSASSCDARCELTLTITGPADDDQCCPAGANANNDNDCEPVCGNGATEPGEVCDDHNLESGDGCDPSCSYFNNLSVLSGYPARVGFSDGTKLEARFDAPHAITAVGKVLYVADYQASVVRKIDASGVVTTVAGSPWDEGACDGSAADNGVGASARFCVPVSIAAVGGKLYVVDSTTEIGGLRVIDLATSVVTSDHSLSSDTISVVKAHGSGSSTTMLFYDGALKHWDPSQPLGASNPQVLASKADISDQTTAQCTGIEWLNSDFYLACGTKLLKVNGGVVSVYAGNGSGCTDNATRLSAGFSYLEDITTNGTDLFVVDSGCHKVRRIASGVSTYAGDGNTGFTDGSASSAQFVYPAGIVYVSGSGFFVADNDNGAVRQILPNTNVTTLAGGINRKRVYAADGPSCRYGTTTIPRPHSLATDGSYAYFWMRYWDTSVARIDLQTGGVEQFAISGAWAQGQPAYPPADLTVLDGYLYLALDGSIWRVPLADGSSPARYAGSDGNPGANDGPIGSASLQPKLLAAAPASKTLYFFDANHTLRRIDTGAANPSVLTLGGVPNATAVMDGDLSIAQFASPLAMAFDGTFLWVLDGTSSDGRRLVRRIDVAGHSVDTILGEDVDAPPSDGSDASMRLLGGYALASDGARLFIADRGASFEGYDGAYGASVREVSLTTLETTTMIGRDDRFTTLVGVGRSAAVFAPSYMTFDPVGKRLLIFDPLEAAFLQLQ
jgi:cysteine-rich repeat protein